MVGALTDRNPPPHAHTVVRRHNAGRQQQAAAFAMPFPCQSAAVAAVAVAVGLTGQAARAFVIPPSAAGALFSGSSSVGGGASASGGYGKASSRSPLRMDASAGEST